jgi:nuclear transport factor 2 (NTF2) superfamily protein
MNSLAHTLLFILIFGMSSANLKADHYKIKGWFQDPYVEGCIYDLLDASFGKRCAQISVRYYFNEAKHKGSYMKAYENCQNYLEELGHRKYRNFNSDDFSIECVEIEG